MKIALKNNECMYCGGRDTVKHTVSIYNRWRQLRDNLEYYLQTNLITDNIIDLMMENKENWKTSKQFYKEVNGQEEGIRERTN